MKIVLASRNKHKISELQALFSKYADDVKILSLDDVGFVGEIEENGETFAENALIKARTVARLGKIGVGDDSGLCVNALGGAPGVYSARYAGVHGDDEANNQKLIAELEGKADRSAYFVCNIACAFPDGREFVIEGRANGEILSEKCGNAGFGYDPIFYVGELGKTFAELTADEKNSVSHRGNAMKAFVEKFSEFKN